MTVAALAPVLLACSDGGPSIQRPHTWHFSSSTDTVVLDRADSDHVVASLTDVLSWSEHLIVVDRVEHNVKAYDLESGELAMVLGRRGAGPGEFVSPMGAAPLPDGRLAVQDALLARVTVFDSLGGVDTTWALPGNFGSGVSALSNGELILPGRIAADGRHVSDSAIHHFTARGEYVRAYLAVPEIEHYGEGALNAFEATVVDSTIIASQLTTNEIVLVDLRTNTVRRDTIGREFYRPIDWTLEPIPTPAEEEAWFREQMIAWWIRELGEGLYAAGFSDWVDSVDARRYRWVFATPEGRAYAVSELTDAQPAFIRDGRLYSVRMRLDGEVEMLVGDAPLPGGRSKLELQEKVGDRPGNAPGQRDG